MAYISRGEVTGKRSPWRLSIIPETFMAIYGLIVAFILTMFSIDASSTYRKKKSDSPRISGFGGGSGRPGGPPGGPGRPGGGGSSGPRLSGMSNVHGVDHTAPPPCGSCCGG